MASLGKLVAGVAHELNSPVGALSSTGGVVVECVSRLRRILDAGKTLEEVRESRDLAKVLNLLDDGTAVVASASARLTGLVKNLRSFARLDEARCRRADILEGIDSTVELLRGRTPASVEIVREYDDIPEITCSPRELNQVFLTLLTNAIEAIDGEGTIRIVVRRGGGRLAIRISDTGKGIPEDRVGRLFDFDFSSG